MKTRKLLIILSLFIMVMLICLIMYSARVEKSPDSEQTNFEENTEEVYGQGTAILKYGNTSYFIDDLAEAIVKYDAVTGESKAIASYINSYIGDQLHIISNHLIYSAGGKTYYSDLEGKQVKKLLDGEILYINEDVYIYLVQEDSWQYLYISSYNDETFRRTNELAFNLAKGYQIEFLKQVEDSLYFTSRNSDDSSSLFEINLKNNKNTLITRQGVYSQLQNSRSAIADVAKAEDKYYYVVDNVVGTTYSESISDSVVFARPVDASYEEFVRENVERKLIIDPNDEDVVLYEEYNAESGEYVWKNIFGSLQSYTWKELVYGDVTKYFSLEDSVVYLDGDKFADISIEIPGLWLDKVIRQPDGFYILFATEKSHVWYFSKEDGSNFAKIYEYNYVGGK